MSNVDIQALIRFHAKQERLATVTAIQPPGRYGSLDLNAERLLVDGFIEKPQGEGGWINGGFFVLDPRVMEFISGDECSWEGESMVKLAKAGQLAAFRHQGFWQAMDTLRERNHLEELWKLRNAPWQVWS